jgi:heptose I phosphotransferase
MNQERRHGSLWQRLVRGSRWTWLAERHRAALPPNLDATVMTLESRDRLHVKQGRSTARVVFHTADGPLSVYLKRHYRLPWPARLAALVDPRGKHSPGAAEWAHLERVRRLGIRVPEAVAAGERVGPWGALQSFLMVAELTGALPLNEALPGLSSGEGKWLRNSHEQPSSNEPIPSLSGREGKWLRNSHEQPSWNESLPGLSGCQDRAAFLAWKRGLIAEMAAITATLHRERLFHKDLYLCHFFLDMERLEQAGSRLTLIDLHRLGEHRLWPDRWRWKDLGQLLYSTEGIAGIDDRDRLRFWMHYRRRLRLPWPRRQFRMIARKAARYRAHNRRDHG